MEGEEWRRGCEGSWAGKNGGGGVRGQSSAWGGLENDSVCSFNKVRLLQIQSVVLQEGA